MDDQATKSGANAGNNEFTLHNGCLLTVRDGTIATNYGPVPEGTPQMNWPEIGKYLDSEVPGFRRLLSGVIAKIQVGSGSGARSGSF